MPEASLTTFSLEGKTPQELETRRREIITDLSTKYKGPDDEAVPLALLQELAAVTASLRRKNAGPPKKAKEPKAPKGAKKDINDILGML